MGVVCSARQHSVGREVAIKFVRCPPADVQPGIHDSYAVKRFFREARACAAISHPNVVTVYDFGQTEDGLLYLVMERLTGASLADLLRAEGRLPPGRVTRIALEVVRGLIEVHSAGLLHRDLKPANVFLALTRGGQHRVKLLDFGLAKALAPEGPEATQLTAPGTFVGTPAYMSPEQYQTSDLTPAADLYAVGCLVYEMLTGQPPFTGHSVQAVMLKAMTTPVTPLAERAPMVPVALADLTMQLLSREAGERPTAETVLTRLCDLCADLPEEPGSVPTIGTPEAMVSMAGMTAQGPRRLVPAVPPIVRGAFRPTLVGREDARSRLEALYEECAAGVGGMVWLEGPGGIGKSRLIEWLESHVKTQGGLTAKGHYNESGMGALGAIRDLIEALYGTAGLSREATAARLSAKALSDTLEADPRASSPEGGRGLDRFALSLVVDFLRPDPDQAAPVNHARTGHTGDNRERLWSALARAIVVGAAPGPTLLVLEDLREDTPLAGLFAQLAVELEAADAAVLVIAAVRTAERPSGKHAREPERVLRDRFHRMWLGPLTESDSKQLLLRALPGADPAVIRRVAALSGGNPLYLLQLVRHLVAEGEVAREGERFVLTSRPSLPAGLSVVIDRRLERLANRGAAGEAGHAVLVRAAILGTRVEQRLLASMLEREGRFDLLEALDAILDRLVRDGLLRDLEVWDTDVLAFEHGFVRETLLERMKGRRAARRLYLVAAEAMAHRHADEPAPAARRIGELFALAGEPARALPWLEVAARGATRRHAPTEAVDAWSAAKEAALAGNVDPRRLQRIDRALAAALIRTGDLERTAEILDALSESPEVAELQGDLADARGRYEEAAARYERACDTRSPSDAARATVKLAWQYHKLGKSELACATFQAGLERGLAAADELVEADALAGLAMVAHSGGDLVAALRYLSRLETLRRSIGEPVELGRCLYTKAVVHWTQGDHSAAMAALGEAIERLESARYDRGLVHALQMAASVQLELDRPQVASDYAVRAWTIADGLGDPRALNRAALTRSDTAGALGRHDDALRWARRAVDSARLLNTPHDLSGSALTLGQALMRAGQPAAALEPLREALSLQAGNPNHISAVCRRHIGDAQHELGDFDEARAEWDKARAIFQQIGNPVEAAELRRRMQSA